MTEYEAIVRAIAASDPNDVLVENYSGSPWCRYGNNGECSEPFDDPANHEPSCLWRRAREVMGD